MLHLRRFGTDLPGAPLVFLHEGLGSVDLWRGFPAAVVEGTGHPGIAYSRVGNGWSTPLAEPRRPDYMHTEALDWLPHIVDDLDDGPPILIGHSDGASIALIYAGSGHETRGLVLIAPHVFVEPETAVAIESIRESFATSDMRDRMSSYHRDPEGTFYGWANIWLSPAFADWNIESYLPGIDCPTLIIQGDADEYGTIRQVDAIEEGVGGPVERLVVRGAGHSPHLSHAEPVVGRIVEFVDRVA